MKKWLIVLLTGVVIFGLGISVSIFEFSEYRIVAPKQTELLADTVTTLIQPISSEGEITIENYYRDIPIEVVADNTLSGQMRVEITGPKIFYQYQLHSQHRLNGNNYYLGFDVDPFKLLSLFLEGAKNNEIYNLHDLDSYDALKITVSLNENDIGRFKPYYESQLYQERQNAEIQQTYYEESVNELDEHYQEEIDNLNQNYEDQLEKQRQNYEEQLESLRQSYEEQLEKQRQNYEGQLERLQNQ